MRIPNRLMPHRGLFAYEPFTGSSFEGAAYGTQVVPERANIQDSTQVARGDMTETETYTASVWLDPGHVVPNGSRVTLWLGTDRERQGVVTRSAYHSQGPGLPEHVELRVA